MDITNYCYWLLFLILGILAVCGISMVVYGYQKRIQIPVHWYVLGAAVLPIVWLITPPHNHRNAKDLSYNQITHYPNCETRRALIDHPGVSEAVLTKLVRYDKDVGVRHDARKRLAFLHGIPKPTASQVPLNSENLFTNQLPEEALSTTALPRLRQLFLLSHDASNAGSILENLASNCFIDAALAQQIYTNALNQKGYERTAILIALATNPHTSTEVLTDLARENDLMVLRALVTNSSLPRPLIESLAQFADCKIRKAIICLPAAQFSVLETLTHDDDESVAYQAKQRMQQDESYLNLCKEVKKINPSCQKYYAPLEPNLRRYPNTSWLETVTTPPLGTASKKNYLVYCKRRFNN